MSQVSLGRRALRWCAPVVVVLGAMAALPAVAQDQPPQPQRGNFDPAQFRQRMMDRMKEMLGATDDEMQALGPKIEKVMQLQRDASGGGMRMMFGRGGPGGPGGDQQPTSTVQQKAKELKDAIDANASPEDIKARMAALREARAAAKAELTKAQNELRELLTQKQEATLLMMGMLE